MRSEPDVIGTVVQWTHGAAAVLADHPHDAAHPWVVLAGCGWPSYIQSWSALLEANGDIWHVAFTGLGGDRDRRRSKGQGSDGRGEGQGHTTGLWS